MHKNNFQDMTTGNPAKLIFGFAFPIFVGNIFQQLYNIIDTMIAGHFLGDNALAAIGATSAINNLIIGMAVGLNAGFAIVVARCYGARNMQRMHNAVAHLLILNCASAFIFTTLGLLILKKLLVLLKTPPEILQHAYRYIGFIVAGMVFTIAFNMGSELLRALGNSKTPLAILSFATLFNLITDYLFIAVFHFGVEGAAYATILSQAISAVLCFLYIIKRCPELRLHKDDFRFNSYLARELLASGSSMGLMGSIVSIGSIILQSAINSFGTGKIASFLAARKIDEMLMLPFNTLSTANATFTGQNFGAGKLPRVKTGQKQTLLLGMGWAAIATAFMFVFSPILVKIITGTSNQMIIDDACYYLRLNVPFFFALGAMNICSATLQGIGRTLVPLFSSSIEMVTKVLTVLFLVPVLGYTGIAICEPVAWILCAAFVMTMFYTDKRFHKLKTT